MHLAFAYRISQVQLEKKQQTDLLYRNHEQCACGLKKESVYSAIGLSMVSSSNSIQFMITWTHQLVHSALNGLLDWAARQAWLLSLTC